MYKLRSFFGIIESSNFATIYQLKYTYLESAQLVIQNETKNLGKNVVGNFFLNCEFSNDIFSTQIFTSFFRSRQVDSKYFLGGSQIGYLEHK